MNFVNPKADRWHTLSGEDGPFVTLTPAPYSLLSLAQWRGARTGWPHGLPVGVQLPNDCDVTEIEADLPQLSLVALQFPKWTDGRAYSQARVLRSRLRYRGEIRALGEVLVDMLPLLHRTGFDAVLLRADQSRASAEQALRRFSAHYQGDAAQPRPIFARSPDELAVLSGQTFIDSGASI